MSATTILRIRSPLPAAAPPVLPAVVRKVGRAFQDRLESLQMPAASLAIGGAAWVSAFYLKYDGHLSPEARTFMIQTLPLLLFLKGVSFWKSGVFNIVWAYVGLADVLTFLRASALIAVAGYGVMALLSPMTTVPGTIVLLDGLLTFLGVTGLYVIRRAAREGRHLRKKAASSPRERVLIVGAGDAGELLLRELQWKFSQTHEVVGFVDDAPGMAGSRLRGIPILGKIDDIRDIAARYRIGQVMIAIPSAGGELIQRITRHVTDSRLQVRVLPAIGQLIGKSALLPQLRDVSMEDLLRRSTVGDESEKVFELLRGKVVLVTGAAGSIGSQLCRQILGHDPARLVVMDCAETPLHDLLLELRKGTNEKVVISEMGDVTDAVRIGDLFARHQPQIVFHAAALKHVPMCESHIREAIRVNIGGTKIVAEASAAAGVSHFVLISTDKAVNPSSVMGATKRVAEILLRQFHAAGGKTRFIAVRFGNVLGSNGSVLPLFKAQLARGGPLTVTHPDMRRYFMAIPEAVGLVLHSACLGEGGDLFELDMGEPIKVVDLAENLIRLSGLVPGKDIRIEFTGMRPGEKLFEELYFNAEQVHPTAHPRVFCLKSECLPEKDAALSQCMAHLRRLGRSSDPVMNRLREDVGRITGSPAEEKEAA